MNVLDNPAGWLRDQIEAFLHALSGLLPSLIGALAILALGWLAAFLVRVLIIRFGRGLDALLSALQRRTGHTGARLRFPVSRLAATLAFWVVILFTLIGVAQALGLEGLAGWLRDLTSYLPRVLIAMLVLGIGYLLSGMVRDTAAAMTESGGFRHGPSLGRALGGLILVFTLLLALAQLGLDVALFANIVTIAAAAVFGAAALAFGLGAGDSVRNIMAAHYVRKTYRPGQRIRLEGLEGPILELTPVSVIMETSEGSVVIPARRFNEQAAVILDEEDEPNA
ncbi:MAG: mechanosensitive ion channel [Chromatiales bacterium]|jgi:small-conductance mechanosensitive channel